MGLWLIIVYKKLYINYDLGLSLTYFFGKVKLGHIGFSMEKSLNIVFFRKFCSL